MPPEETKINVTEGNVEAKNTSDIIKMETTLLENKYFRWIISIGVAFLVFKALDTGAELSYLKGQQESFDKTISTLFETRDELIKQLKEENSELKSKTFNVEEIKLANERLKFEIEQLKAQQKNK